jgi:hypothetical protein
MPRRYPPQAASGSWPAWDLSRIPACSFVIRLYAFRYENAVQFPSVPKKKAKKKPAKKTPLVRIVPLTKVPKTVIRRARKKVDLFE